MAIAPPTNLKAAVSGNTVVLTWSEPPTAQGYNLWQAPTPQALSALPNTLSGAIPLAGGLGNEIFRGTITHTITNLPDGTHCFALTSWDCSSFPCVESAQSNSVSVTLPPPVASQPSGLKVLITATGAEAPVVHTLAGVTTIAFTCQSVDVNYT